MITYEALTGVETRLARRVLSAARSIAPALDTLTGERRAEAIAILQGVADDAAVIRRGIKSQSVAGARVDYTPTDSWFTRDDRSSLRALCLAESKSTPSGAHPIGSFPKAGLITSIWKEDGSCR
ncbi:hypothetical protein [Pseudoclavibacter sp. 8L]|uniref:hypothetical protein n=1 Tax=Pseudoclavibacter sp. 8L TaxID=2653162 RepID=UPI0012F16932|nr:hypothetical protein [Pseudoclavibacter sp. 8L]VXB32941.1 conserved hypothetical protein [Pseudoclavibacter sp. 8L]